MDGAEKTRCPAAPGDGESPPESFDLLVADINGIFRGARMPPSEAEAILESGASFPASVYALRHDGRVVEETGMGLCAGDNDYPIAVLPDTVRPMPWRDGGRQGVFVMSTPEGRSFFADPRQVLARVVGEFQTMGLVPVLAAELEFFLHPEKDGKNSAAAGVYAMEVIDRHESLIDLMARTAAMQGVPVGALTSEYAPGQMEINLRHGEAQQSCLDALLFRRLVRGCARRFGREATFMAKPRAGMSGSGLHLHLSFLQIDGDYLFADEEKLLNAAAGALAVVNEGMLFFAPFDNSYRRFAPGNYVPLSASWGHENRSAAVRIPAANDAAARRLEFRLPGADANPYLAAAALLAGVCHGLRESLRPPKELTGEYAGAAKFPVTWRAAIDTFARAKILPQYIAPAFLRHYCKIKESEWRHCRDYVTDYDAKFYGAMI